jgi:hypothetical protein
MTLSIQKVGAGTQNDRERVLLKLNAPTTT